METFYRLFKNILSLRYFLTCYRKIYGKWNVL